ncbi:unnamed protein product [Cuscuta epithymum]|nr:unnamed protein product [Cuscuta epithymum]CAH9145938.1 unnamed protein product [Cuscuta epithymum]
MCAFNIRLTGYNKMDSCSFSPLNDSDSGVSCSVGSCSVTSECRADFPFHFVPGALCSDAESVCCSGDEEEIHSSPHPQEEDLAESIHRLELHAYHSTLEALYASGPLSWEQETMLTNLRITLHISNDEHLLELKNLISAKSCKYYVRQ